jgi:hypothetical protein
MSLLGALMDQTRFIDHHVGSLRCAWRQSGNPLNGDGSARIVEEDKKFRNETVQLDGKLFVNCRFEDCLLTYSGATCEWEHSSFFNCRILLNRSASNTAEVLRGLGFSIGAPERIATSWPFQPKAQLL